MPPHNDKSILLVHPLGYSLEKAAGDISRVANIMPPLGLASIAAYLDERGFTTALIDCYARPATSDQLIRRYVSEQQPGFIGFSCTTSSFLDGVQLARMAKEVLPGIKTVFGGPHVSALQEKILTDYREVDFVVVGEGEETLHELLTTPAGKLSQVASLIWRDAGGRVTVNDQKRPLLDLDTLPFPAYEKLAGFPEQYQLPIFNYPKEPNTSCISSRGCPYACSYCDRSVFRRSFRYNSADNLYRHLAHLRERFGIRHINFYDDQFTLNRGRVEEFCQTLINAPLGMTFNCAARAEHLDFELLKLMKKAGCWMISVGIETGDENLLAQHRQNADLTMLADKIRLIDKAGIRVKGLFMMGLPGETEASIQKSMDYVSSLPIADFNLTKFTPFPGSPVYQNIHQLGSFEEDWEKMDCMNFLFIPNGMDKERMEKLFVNFYMSHFMRPKVLWGYVTMLWKSPSSCRRFALNFFSLLSFVRRNRRLQES